MGYRDDLDTLAARQLAEAQASVSQRITVEMGEIDELDPGDGSRVNKHP